MQLGDSVFICFKTLPAQTFDKQVLIVPCVAPSSFGTSVPVRYKIPFWETLSTILAEGLAMTGSDPLLVGLMLYVPTLALLESLASV